MINLFKWFIGGKIQAIIGIVFALVILITPVYLYATYKNAMSDAQRFKHERDGLVIENLELTAYNVDLLIKIDSVVLKMLDDSTMYVGHIGNIQKLVLKQKELITDKNILIDELKSGLRCKNFFGKIVDC